MCMYLDKRATQRFRKKMKTAGGKHVGWAIYIPTRYGNLVPPWNRERRVREFGWVYTTRQEQRAGRDALDSRPHALAERSCINRGKHIFRTRAAAVACIRHFWDHYAAWRFRGACVVPVQCHLRDLVGAGRQELQDWPSAVFTKVRLLKKDFDAAMAGARDA